MEATAVAAGAGSTTVAGARGASVGGAGLGLELPVGRRRRLLHFGRKLCPPRVFTMAGLEREKRWRAWEVSEVIWN